MKHATTPLRRLLPREPVVEIDDIEELATTRPGPFEDPQGDEAWRDAVAEHASMQVRERR